MKIISFVTLNVLGRDDKMHFFSNSGISWFAFALAAFVLISYLLRDINPGLLLIMSVFLACFVGYDRGFDDLFITFRIFNFYPYYVLGIVMDRAKLQKVLEKKQTVALGAVILVIWAIVCICSVDKVFAFRALFFGYKSYEPDLYKVGWLYRLGSYILALVVGGACICVMPKNKIPVISECGKKTLQVYFWHRAILYVFMELNVFGNLCGTVMGKVTYLLVAIALTFLLSMKPFSFPTEHIMKYSKMRYRQEKSDELY